VSLCVGGGVGLGLRYDEDFSFLIVFKRFNLRPIMKLCCVGHIC